MNKSSFSNYAEGIGKLAPSSRMNRASNYKIQMDLKVNLFIEMHYRLKARLLIEDLFLAHITVQDKVLI